jgi:hypothetical protein
MANLSDDFHFQLTASSVVDLTRTSCAFVHNNLLTQKRDPRMRRVGDILAKIPSRAQFNEIDHYSADAFVSVANRYLSCKSLRLNDDDGRTLELNGGRFTDTLKLSFDRSNEQDEPVQAAGGPAAAERAAGGACGPQSNIIAVPELAAWVTVEEGENDRHDAELELQGADLELEGADLESLSATVLGFADEVSMDAISAATDGGGVSVGASLLPEPDTALVSETHEWADAFAADVTLDDESLTDTLQALRDNIAAVDPEHPSTVSLQCIDELNWTEGIVVNGDLIPHEPHPGFPFHRVEAPINPWLEGHFVNIYANNILSADADGGQPRRVLLDGDPSAIGQQGPQGEQGPRGLQGPQGEQGEP